MVAIDRRATVQESPALGHRGLPTKEAVLDNQPVPQLIVVCAYARSFPSRIFSSLAFSSQPSLHVSLPAADNKALPVAPPAVAPSSLDIVTFDVHVEGENHKLVVTTGPSQMRVDEPNDGYSVIYNPLTQHYTGLEHRNYTYWEFSWPDVRDAITASKRYETHLQDLGNQGMNDDYAQPAAADSSTTTSSSAGTDNSGYVWRPTMDKKKDRGLDCVRWTSDTISGQSVEAWCYAGPLPKIQAALDHVRSINEPMALVPVRTLVPAIVFPVYDALVKGGVTPVLIIWGGDRDKNHFGVVDAQIRKNDGHLFIVPKLYMKTTLVTMDGLIDQKK